MALIAAQPREMHMSRLRTALGFFFARGLLGVAIVSGALGVVANVLNAFKSDSLHRDLDLGRGGRVPAPRSGSVEGVRASWDGEVTITIEDPSAGLTLLDAAPATLLSLATVAAAWLLFIVVIDVQRGVPFEVRSVGRLGISGVVIATAPLLLVSLSAWADVAVLDAAGRQGRGFGYQLFTRILPAAPWLIIAATLFAIARAFVAGRRLTDDTEGLV